MRSSRTTHLILAGTLGFGSLVALASPAMADTPAQEADEMVLVFAPSDPEPEGPIFAPAPAPDPEVDEDKAPLPLPMPLPQPDPTPDADLPVAQPTGHGDPEPEGDLPLGTPEADPDPEDGFEGPDDLTSDLGCTWAHNCLDEDPTPDGHCFDEAGEVVDPSECIPTDDGDQPDSSTDVEVEGSSTDRGALPRTGAGVVALAVAGSALTGLGAALRKVAKR